MLTVLMILKVVPVDSKMNALTMLKETLLKLRLNTHILVSQDLASPNLMALLKLIHTNKFKRIQLINLKQPLLNNLSLLQLMPLLILSCTIWKVLLLTKNAALLLIMQFLQLDTELKTVLSTSLSRIPGAQTGEKKVT